MVYEEDFVRSELVEVNVNGRVFKLKDLSGPEVDALTEKYMKIDLENESFSMDLGVKNSELLKCVVDAPYKIGDKDFKDASVEERVACLNRLKNGVRQQLLKVINSNLGVSEELKKK